MDKFGGDLDFKLRYMEEASSNYSDSSCRNIVLSLKNAKAYENLYGKELYNFQKNELVGMLNGFRSKTSNALEHRMSIYRKYIERAVELGLTEENGMDRIKRAQYLDMVDSEATESRYITRAELFSALSELTNAQDQVIFALLFDGVMGHNYGNIANLRVENIKFLNYEARLSDGLNIKLSDETMYIVDEAIGEEEYYTNKESILVYPLKSNGYVVRAPKRVKGNELEAISSNGLRTRIHVMKQRIGMTGLTGRSIFLSGVAERAIEAGLLGATGTVLGIWLKEKGVKTNSEEMAEIVSLVGRKMGINS